MLEANGGLHQGSQNFKENLPCFSVECRSKLILAETGCHRYSIICNSCGYSKRQNKLQNVHKLIQYNKMQHLTEVLIISRVAMFVEVILVNVKTNFGGPPRWEETQAT